MADVELVIKIPEEYHKAIMEIPVGQLTADMMIIRTGRPLPKGHGRLIDGNAVWEKLKALEEYYQTECTKESSIVHDVAMHSRLYGFTNSKFIVQDAPTIIEAESEDK